MENGIIKITFDCSDKIRKSVKARDQYGPILSIVEEKKRRAVAEGPFHHRHEDSSSKTDSASNAVAGPETSLALFR